MTGFSADWLSLREPADAKARDIDLTMQLAERVCLHSPARFIDLACGTGANLRYLAPRMDGRRMDRERMRSEAMPGGPMPGEPMPSGPMPNESMPGEQQWLLVDSDASLLKKAGAVRGCRVETRCLDLVTNLPALDFGLDTVVTASALLDLVSDRWLIQLVEQCLDARCAALFALSYDGRIKLTPTDPDDEWIRQLVNLHQLGDKGFGPALGPGAGRRAHGLFHAAGYQVRAARSDWSLQPAEQLLQRALLEGWASAATELASNETDRCLRWLARRLAHLANQTSHITVGHEDVLALPP